MSRLELSPAAVEDIRQILLYISRDRPGAAARLVAAIRQRCRILAQNPNLGERRDDLALGVRVFSSGNYGIYYRPLDEMVRVERVLHGARSVTPELF